MEDARAEMLSTYPQEMAMLKSCFFFGIFGSKMGRTAVNSRIGDKNVFKSNSAVSRIVDVAIYLSYLAVRTAPGWQKHMLV